MIVPDSLHVHDDVQRCIHEYIDTNVTHISYV
jgi:hypothetical protein